MFYNNLPHMIIFCKKIPSLETAGEVSKALASGAKFKMNAKNLRCSKSKILNKGRLGAVPGWNLRQQERWGSKVTTNIFRVDFSACLTFDGNSPHVSQFLLTGSDLK